ncbi:MAG TPA: hypothetical protein VFL62_07470 [Bradyrhizobium sp.]|nr:hypothetical protein [Bradyrhizobium sp.]HET7886048.1 hypothetical protein [Bradyrhizobium sp.]
MSFIRYARVEARGYLLSLNLRVSDSPVVSVNQIGLIKNVGDRTKFGIVDELRPCPSGYRVSQEVHVAHLSWLAELGHEAQGPKQRPGGFVPPRELNAVVLRGGTVEHEGEFFGREMRPESV